MLVRAATPRDRIREAMLFASSLFLVLIAVDAATFWPAVIGAVFTGVAGLYNLYLSHAARKTQVQEVIPKMEAVQAAATEAKDAVNGVVAQHGDAIAKLASISEQIVPDYIAYRKAQNAKNA